MLQLFGSGTFDLSTLVQFIGFEEVDVTNVSGGSSSLKLRNGVDLTVNIDNEANSGGQIWLADGETTLNLGNSLGYSVYGSTGTATITSSAGGYFNLSSGDTTINVEGEGATFILSTGSADITYSGSGYTSTTVSSGHVSLDLSGSTDWNEVHIDHPDTIDYSDIITGNALPGHNTLYVNGSGEDLDLTQLTISGRWDLYIGEHHESDITVDVDDASLLFIDKIYVGSTGDKINTAAASLDLTQTPLVLGNPGITSTNATGTTFTVADVTTGLHVVGGTGDDTLILQGLSFTAGQRDAIFALGSVEHISRCFGSLSGDASDQPDDGPRPDRRRSGYLVVNGLSTTLNATDNLDGGDGYDVLQLFGSGTFDLSTLVQFTGFEEVDVTNISGGSSSLKLRNGVDLTVNIDNEANSGGQIWLADGETTLNLGNSLGYSVYGSTGTATITSSAGGYFNLSSGDTTINVEGEGATFILSTGSADITYSGSGYTSTTVSSGHVSLDLSGSTDWNEVHIDHPDTIDYSDIITGNALPGHNTLYVNGSGEDLDLTQLTISGRWDLYIGEHHESDITVDVDDASLLFIDKIYVGSTGDKIDTAAASLDLTQTPLVLGNPSITSTNATGTTFTVADVTTGLHVVGGTGDDTLILQGLSFTAGQRDAIFAQGSVEHITDLSGSYDNPLLI